MKISDHTIKALYETITGDNKKADYRSGRELVDFFDEFGFEPLDGRSRWMYVRDRIEKLNGTYLLEKVILKTVDPRLYIDTPYHVDKVVEYLNQFFVHDGFKLIKDGHIYRVEYLSSNKKIAKNLIFASNGPKPEIVLSDTISYEIEIPKNKEYCLIYDQPISNEGLTWRVLVNWWANKYAVTGDKDRAFYKRLSDSLDSKPEKIFFHTYYSLYNPNHLDDFPVLIPQVYLHYDPRTLKELRGEKRLLRQRMDFLLLLPRGVRVVIEIDGKQHYADGDKVSPKKYSEMVSEDRKLKLNGYDIYRFGGYEFQNKKASKIMIKNFFEKLFDKYKVEIR